jgi:hypothetical protein
MGLAPDPQFDERSGTMYQREIAASRPGNRGPLRFEEGIASDTDVPNDFVRGMTEAAIPAPGRPNHVNPDILFKHADEVMKERAHVGSASWIDSRSMLGDFSAGAFNEKEVTYEQVTRSGARQARRNPAVVND